MTRSMKSQAKSVELAIIGHNKTIGEEDTLEGGIHLSSAQCLSQKAEVLAIDKDEFLRILRTQQNHHSLKAQAV